MTLIPIIGVGAYALTSMLNGIAVEKELVEIKEAIREVHDLGDMVHYLEVSLRRVHCTNRMPWRIQWGHQPRKGGGANSRCSYVS